MRVFIRLLFLTLVLAGFTAVAAPEVKSEQSPLPLDATPIRDFGERASVSPYNLALYGGFAGGNLFEADEKIAGSVWGLRFSVDRDEDTAWDTSAEVDLPDNLIGLHVGRRSAFLTLSDFRPYYKLAVGTHLKGSDGLANFAEIKRWQARASLGFADLFGDDEPLYLEAGVGMAVVGFETFIQLGLNFNL